VTEVLVAADVRFPLERANGVQIVKTAAALTRAGAAATLLVRDSDPRSTDEILPLFGIAPGSLRVRRLAVLHRRGSFFLPRAAFLARALAASLAALRRGAVVFTRDLQLADLLLSLRRRARVVYEAHAVESILYGERGALYGTADQPRPGKAARLRRREARVWRRARAFVTTTAGIRDTFTEQFGARAGVSVIGNGCDVPADRVELRGHVPQAEVARELVLARVVAVPVRRTDMTLRHTSPLKAFEAMAAGRPIVASDLPSSREFLRHGENAWLVAPDDPAALAAGITRLLDDEKTSERIARTAFEDAVAFSWDARARRLLDAFAEIA
jgi:hypothetical protein